MTTDELVAILIQYPGHPVLLETERSIVGITPMEKGGVMRDQFEADEGPVVVIRPYFEDPEY